MKTHGTLAPPAGMRDLLPPEAAARQWLGEELTRIFGTWGYELVTTPPFEHAEVIERGLDTVDRRDLLRFVEPESGEVALLRPDITPQIARVVATRLAHRPPPFRLCYAGSVIRQRQGRARRQRQIAQAGVEHIGSAGADADAEVIALAVRTLEKLGLEQFHVELHAVGLVRELITELPTAAREPALRAIAQKDGAELRRIIGDVRVARSLTAAIDLYGGLEVLRDARKVFGAALKPLTAIVRSLEARGIGPRIALDLGEARDAGYYTGVSFTILAPGPGEPLGAGGRYDGLLGRFGAPLPATGFGLDLANVEWALASAGRSIEAPRPIRLVVAGDDAEETSNALRAAGHAAAVIASRGALDYARAWGYDASVICRRGRLDAVRAHDGATRSFSDRTLTKLEALARWASAARTVPSRTGRG
jgi:ATP phosphoribosyltransferase regulatory subunit